MTQSQKAEKRSFYSLLCKVTAPVILQNAVTLGASVIGSVMIGRLSGVAVGSVYFGNVVQTLLTILIAGIETATVAVGAQYFGKGDREKWGTVCKIGGICALSLGILLTFICFFFTHLIIGIFSSNSEIIDTGSVYLKICALSFIPFSMSGAIIGALRSTKNVSPGLYSSLIAFAANFLFGYVLIFGKLSFSPLGILGAAIATVTARVLELIYLTVYVLIKKELRGSLKIYKIPHFRECGRELLKIGSPIVLSQCVWALNSLFSSGILGKQQAEGLSAALGIAATANGISYIAISAMTTAAAIIAANAAGEGNESKIKSLIRYGQPIFLLTGVLSALITLLLRTPLIAFYKVSAESKEIASLLILIICITAVGCGYQLGCLNGIVRGLGDTRFTLTLDSIFTFLVVMPPALIASRVAAPPAVIFLLLRSDLILKCVVAYIKVNKQSKVVKVGTG